MTDAEIYEGLDEIFRDVFFRDDIILKPGLSAKDVDGWTSFTQVDIILAVEERFNIRLTSREVDTLTNVGDLVQLIASKAT